jgi:drug/metabolite transporter (DMT)-like permease
MPAAALALLGALVYGSADFLGGLAAKRLRSIVVTCVAAASGLLVLALAYPFFEERWTASDVAWGALSGVIGVVAIGLLYACLAIGPMSILSPLTAVVSAIAPMIWGLTIGGEQLSPIGFGGLAVALVAVVLVGFIPGQGAVRPRPRGILMAIGSGLAIGAFLIVMDQTSPSSGVVPLILNRGVNALITAAIVGVLIIAAVRRGRTAAAALAPQGTVVGATPTGHADLEHTGTVPVGPAHAIPARAWTLAIACGLVDTLANVLMLVALRLGDLSVVAALTAMYPAGTIILAALVLRERIAAVQWVGLVLALAAGGMLAVA